MSDLRLWSNHKHLYPTLAALCTMESPDLTMTMGLGAVLINSCRFIGSICEDQTKPLQPSSTHTGSNITDMSQMGLGAQLFLSLKSASCTNQM